MMHQVSQNVYALLKSVDDANNYFDAQIYPLVAPIDTENDYVVYQVRKEAAFSKQGIHDVYVEIVVCSRDYDRICQIADSIESAADDDQDMHYQTTTTGVDPDNTIEFQFNIKYNLKMIKS